MLVEFHAFRFKYRPWGVESIDWKFFFASNRSGFGDFSVGTISKSGYDQATKMSSNRLFKVCLFFVIVSLWLLNCECKFVDALSTSCMWRIQNVCVQLHLLNGCPCKLWSVLWNVFCLSCCFKGCYFPKKDTALTMVCKLRGSWKEVYSWFLRGVAHWLPKGASAIMAKR